MEFGVRIFVFHIRILTNIRFQCLSVEFNKFVRHTSCPILVLSNYFEGFITLLLCFKLIVYPKRILKINFNSIVYRTFVDCFDVCWWSEWNYCFPYRCLYFLHPRELCLRRASCAIILPIFVDVKTNVYELSTTVVVIYFVCHVLGLRVKQYIYCWFLDRTSTLLHLWVTHWILLTRYWLVPNTGRHFEIKYRLIMNQW